MANGDYKTLKAQLEALHEKTEAARIAELEAVIADIREKVAEYGITAEQIFGRQRVGKGKTVGAHVAAKYQNPKTGETWSGRGRAPAWIKDVKNRTRFLIGAAAEAPSTAGKAATRTAAKKAVAKTQKADAKSVKSAGATVARERGRPSTNVAATKTRSQRAPRVKKAAGAVKPEVVTEAASE